MRTVKKLLLPALLFTTATAALITPSPVEACGPYYLPQYNDNNVNPYEILLEKRMAIRRFAELYPEMLPPAGTEKPYLWIRCKGIDPAKTTPLTVQIKE